MHVFGIASKVAIFGIWVLVESSHAAPQHQGAPSSLLLAHQRERVNFSTLSQRKETLSKFRISGLSIKENCGQALTLTQRLVLLRGGSAGASSSTSPAQPSDLAHKLANLGERTLPATILLISLFGIVKFFGKAGLSALVLALSPGLYAEMVSVVLQDQDDGVKDGSTAPAVANATLSDEVGLGATEKLAPESTDVTLVQSKEILRTTVSQPSFKRSSNQWWWFLAMSLPTTLSRYLEPKVTLPTLQLASFGMMLAGWMAWIVGLNQSSSTTPQDFRRALREVGVYHLAGLVSILPVSCWMATLAEFSTGQSWVLYSAMLVILNDTLAYLFGVSLGKHALLPVISPKKTMEGWMGALVSTTLLSYFVWKVFFPVSYGQDSLAVALFCSLVAPFGGFLASAVKRAYNKKDFSNLIAGHGGLVDRLDCQLITAPFVYLLLNAMEPVDVFAEKFGHAAIPNF